MLKRNCFASVFEKYFKFQEEGKEGEQRAVVHYRDDESMYAGQSWPDYVLIWVRTVLISVKPSVSSGMWRPRRTEWRLCSAQCSKTTTTSSSAKSSCRCVRPRNLLFSLRSVVESPLQGVCTCVCVCRSSKRGGEPATQPPRCCSATGSPRWSWRTQMPPSGTTLVTSPLVRSRQSFVCAAPDHRSARWRPAAFMFPVLFPRHTNANARDNTINLIHTFRDYLHYHIKCSKVSPTSGGAVWKNQPPSCVRRSNFTELEIETRALRVLFRMVTTAVHTASLWVDHH